MRTIVMYGMRIGGVVSFLLVVFAAIAIYIPFNISDDDMRQSTVVATKEAFRDSGLGGDVYVSINNQDPDNDFYDLAKFSARKVKLHGISEIPECRYPLRDLTEESCGQRGVMRGEFIDMPISVMALINVSTLACGTRVITVKFFGRWFIWSKHGWCT